MTIFEVLKIKMFNRHDIDRDACQLAGKLSERGYDWWWHSFTGHDEQTGEQKQFFIEFFLCNPSGGKDKPVFGQSKASRAAGTKPSYLMIKAGAWGHDGAQLHKFYGWKKIDVEYSTPFSISAGDFFLSETGTKGVINISEDDAKKYKEWMCQSGQMAWSLVMDKKISFNVGYGAGKLFRKYIGNKLIANNTTIKKMIGAASLEAEKAASAFLLSIGVEMLVWPQSQTKPDGLQNRLIYDASKIKIVKIEQVSYDEKGKYIPGSEKEVIL